MNHQSLNERSPLDEDIVIPNKESESSCVCVCVCVLGTQLCPTLSKPTDCSPPGSSDHGILQVRILEWVAIPFSRGSSQLRDQSQVSCTAGGFFTLWATRGALNPPVVLLRQNVSGGQGLPHITQPLNSPLLPYPFSSAQTPVSKTFWPPGLGQFTL